MKKLPAVALSITAAVLAVAHVRDAEACGGCFHEPPRPNEVESLITDHRMVFSISQTQTVLWDQVRYSGDPALFAWVLPVHPGAHIELSHDAFIAALDGSTQPGVIAPPSTCANGLGYDGTSGGGLGCGMSSSDSATFAAAPAPDAGSSGGVTVVSQETVGPYEAVTLRATMGDKLDTWLTTNGFAVPASIEPTLAAYTAEGFDFIALKLRPGQGVRAMQPVRVVTQGADPSLPLRMVAAGVGANVGIELYVIAEGRYHTQNFPDAVVDFTKLAWDPVAARSNFGELEAAALGAGDGRGWITQAASPTAFSGSDGIHPAVRTSYYQLCVPTYPTPAPCDAAAPPDSSADDAGDAATDAAPDAAAPDAACPPPPPPALCDDVDVATSGMIGPIWVTRLRANLPANALAVGDLRIEAAPDQALVQSTHQAYVYTDPKYDPCPKSGASQPSQSSSGCACNTRAQDDRLGTWFMLGLTALGTAAILRRRRR